MKRIDDHKWQVTQPTPIQIGRPASRPTDAALESLRDAVASSGATTIYWFWCSIGGDKPHLGLAVAPADDAIISRLGRAVEPIWKQHSPNNTLCDILRLGSSTDDAIIAQGEILYELSPTPNANPLFPAMEVASLLPAGMKPNSETAVSPDALIRDAVPPAVVVILAEHPDPKSYKLPLQNYLRDGQSYIPIFRSMESFRQSTKGAVDKPTYQIDRRLLVSVLRGPETIILDVTLPNEVVMTGIELKRIFPEPFARLPPASNK